MHPLSDTQAFFDDVVPRWILDTDERSGRLQDIFTQYKIPLDGPLLDVGGGAGILLPLLRRHATPGTRIVELEVAREMLRMARHMHDELADIDYLLADGHRLPFSNGSFGGIHCFSVFPHFHDPHTALSEFHRCLRAGGHLCILHLMGHEQLNQLHRDAGRVVAEDVLPPVDVLSHIVEQAGFRVIQSQERSDLYLLMAEAS
jgi:ubiquinone/menaquinone biosynthesis C-methylase UbiE